MLRMQREINMKHNTHNGLAEFKLLLVSSALLTTLGGWAVIAIKRPPPLRMSGPHATNNALLASIARAAPPAPVADSASSR
jgi:hypothetical protein